MCFYRPSPLRKRKMMFLSSVQPGARQQDKFDKPRQSSPQGGRLQRYPHHKPGEVCSNLLLLTLHLPGHLPLQQGGVACPSRGPRSCQGGRRRWRRSINQSINHLFQDYFRSCSKETSHSSSPLAASLCPSLTFSAWDEN